MRFRSKLVLSKGVLCIAPSTESSALDGSRVGAGEARSGTQSRPGHTLCWSHIPSQSFGPLLTCCPQECQQGLPLPHSDVVPSISQLWPPNSTLPLAAAAFILVGCSPTEQEGPKWASLWVKVYGWVVMGNWPESGQSQSAYSALFGEQGNMYVNFTSGVQVSHSAPQPHQSCWSSSQQQDSSSWYGTQSLAYPICGWNHLLPRKYLQACVISPFCVPSQGCRS